MRQPLFLCPAVRFAHRVASEAGLARGLPALPPLKTGPRAGFPGATGPGTVAGVKASWRKSSNGSGDSAAFFGSFLGSKKERPRQTQLAENPQHQMPVRSAHCPKYSIPRSTSGSRTSRAEVNMRRVRMEPLR